MEKTITIRLGNADQEDIKEIILDALADQGYEAEANEGGDTITISADEDESETESESNDDE